MKYNPYELVKLVINGKPIDGRPYEFDSLVVNQKTMKNGFGKFVKPTKVASVCPDCGQGLNIDLNLPDPPFQPVSYSCPYCRPAPPPLVDPFVNPLESGRVAVADLDPLLHNPDKPLPITEETVAARFKAPPPNQEGELVPAHVDSPRSKTKTPLPPPAPIMVEPAEGLSEEQDFDDSDLVEPE